MSSYNRDPEYRALKDTVYGEARGECLEGQKGVAYVIVNRVNANRSYFGGGTFRGVCYCPSQFECHTKGFDVNSEPRAYARIDDWLPRIYDRMSVPSEFDRVYWFNNPDKEGPLKCNEKHVKRAFRIGKHVFYKER
jgi:spore germination cell wall hydrolase CwlJ-like protein